MQFILPFVVSFVVATVFVAVVIVLSFSDQCHEYWWHRRYDNYFVVVVVAIRLQLRFDSLMMGPLGVCRSTYSLHANEHVMRRSA